MLAVMEKIEKEEFFGEMRQEISWAVDKAVASAMGPFIEHVDDKFALVAERFDGVDSRLDALKQTVDSHTEMIGNLVVDMTIVRETLENKADKKDLLALEERVVRLEQS